MMLIDSVQRCSSLIGRVFVCVLKNETQTKIMYPLSLSDKNWSIIMLVRVMKIFLPAEMKYWH